MVIRGFTIFRLSASLATNPVSLVADLTFDRASVPGQISAVPCFLGTNVLPSGRLPSEQIIPADSRWLVRPLNNIIDSCMYGVLTLTVSTCTFKTRGY